MKCFLVVQVCCFEKNSKKLMRVGYITHTYTQTNTHETHTQRL